MGPIHHGTQPLGEGWIWGYPSPFANETKLYPPQGPDCLRGMCDSSQFLSQMTRSPKMYSIPLSLVYLPWQSTGDFCVAGSPEGICDLSHAVPNCHKCHCPFLYFSIGCFFESSLVLFSWFPVSYHTPLCPSNHLHLSILLPYKLLPCSIPVFLFFKNLSSPLCYISLVFFLFDF